jgi:hypothetical protein
VGGGGTSLYKEDAEESCADCWHREAGGHQEREPGYGGAKTDEDEGEGAHGDVSQWVGWVYVQDASLL